MTSDPTRGWARPKISRDDSRALTPGQGAALWRLDVSVEHGTIADSSLLAQAHAVPAER